MNPSVDEALAWDLHGLHAAATDLALLANTLVETASAARRSVDSDPDWSGVTHAAAHRRIASLVVRLKIVARIAAASADSLTFAHRALTADQSRLADLVATARHQGFAVAPDGVITHPDPTRRADALHLSTRVTGAFAHLVLMDTTAAASLGEAMSQLDGTGKAMAMPSGRPGTPSKVLAELKDQNVDERRAFWEALPTAARESLIRLSSHDLGNLVGIPFADRALANRYSMLAERDRLDAAGEGASPQAARLREMLADNRQFINYDPAGDGMYAELVGTLAPDISNVAVFVPGTGAGLDDQASLRRRALAMNAQSGAPVVVWVNTALPQVIVGNPLSTPLDLMAIDNSRAREGGIKLVGFGYELGAELLTAAPGARTTYIGHSYGGSIVGTAEQLGLRADRIVFASSAGTGAGGFVDVGRVEQQYSITAPGDPIHAAQQFGGAMHGGDPDTAAGVTRIDSGYSAPSVSGQRDLLAGADAHSSYLDQPDSDAFRAVTDVIAGREPPHYVERAPDIPFFTQAERTAKVLGESTLSAVTDVLLSPITRVFG